MMRAYTVIFVFSLLSPACRPAPAEESQSVVSVYTTDATTAGTGAPLDVYHQIANNIAERITSPIYKFLGINQTKADITTKKPWNNIELLDDADIPAKNDVKPVDNDIETPRDVETVTTDAARKTDRKPEKITLYSSYLPVNNKLELNDTYTASDDDDSFGFDDIDDDNADDVEGKGGRDGPLTYILELFGGLFQLLWGGFLALFRPSSS